MAEVDTTGNISNINLVEQVNSKTQRMTDNITQHSTDLNKPEKKGLLESESYNHHEEDYVEEGKLILLK